MRSGAGPSPLWFASSTADGHLALCRGPQDGVHLALDDPTRIGLQKDFRLVAWLDIAQLVLVIESKNPGVILLDKAHHGIGGDRRRAHAGLESEIRHATVGRREMDAAVEIVFRIDQVCFRLADLRLACDSVASAARNSLSRLPRSLCACSRSARFPGPGCGERGELLHPLFRQVDPRGQ